jgi:hypothetical protein
VTLAGAALLALALAAPAGAAPVEIAVDPRFELLGVVQQLAGLAREGADTAAYRKAIDLRFARFRGHPAVELYRDMASSPAREEASAVILLYFTAPPELKLKDKDADIHYLNGEGRREEMQRFIWELRALARESGFMAFFKENAAYYRGAEDQARAKFRGLDPTAVMESFLGVGLSSRSHYILPLLAPQTHNFIVPYPLPPASLGVKSFDVYTLYAAAPADFASVWNEPLYAFIDPSFHYFEKLNIPDPEAFYGADIARCRAVSPECTKQFVVFALFGRLNRELQAPAPNAEPYYLKDFSSERDRRYMKALSERLDEYDRERAKYPTLWSFYPRLFSVFHELAYDGKPGKLSVPADPPIRNAADFFDPRVVEKLRR